MGEPTLAVLPVSLRAFMVYGRGLWLVVLAPMVHILDGSVKCKVRGMGTENTIQRDRNCNISQSGARKVMTTPPQCLCDTPTVALPSQNTEQASESHGKQLQTEC